jgi:S1-C subfamily serine protease
MKKINTIFVSVLVLLNTSCITLKNNINVDVEKTNYTAKIIRQPRLAFFQIKNTFMHGCNLTLKNPETSKDSICDINSALASGVLVNKTDKGFYILTAAHICKIEEVKDIKIQQLVIYDLNKKMYFSDIVAIDTKNDLCLLYSKEKIDTIPVTISRVKPEPADRIYNIAAPSGIYTKDMVPIFDGRYLGDEENNSFYSVYATHGSSGSMILNHRGDLIGILTHVLGNMPVVRSPLLSDIIKIFENNKNNTKELDVL